MRSGGGWRQASSHPGGGSWDAAEGGVLDLGGRSKVYRDVMVLRVSDLAAEVGVTTDAIRFYEREGLLPPPERTRSGYRQFDEAAVRRVRFIKGAQGLCHAALGVHSTRRDLLTCCAICGSAPLFGCRRSPSCTTAPSDSEMRRKRPSDRHR